MVVPDFQTLLLPALRPLRFRLPLMSGADCFAGLWAVPLPARA